jgi:hypothetical protein
MADDNKGSNSSAVFISFLAGLAVGAGAILFMENALQDSSQDDYESEQLFV